MQDILTGLAFVLVIEGLIYALFPASARRMAEEVMKIPDNALRYGGVVAMAAGVVLVWVLRG